jgi:hypothetical protein
MCYSGRCIWESHMGDCVYPHPNHNFRKIFPHTLCYQGEEGEDSDYVKKVEIEYESYKQIIRETNLTTEKEKMFLKQAERKLKILEIQSDEHTDKNNTDKNR